MRRQGKIVEWDDARGFGFVLWHGGDERAFAHISAFAHRGMRPAVGDVVTYDVSADARGRPKATGIAHPGASALARQRLMPGSSQRGPPPLARWLTAAAITAIAASLAWSYTQQRQLHQVFEATVRASPAIPVAAPTASGFECTGKQHCSQMSSCAEARHYLSHCPDTKMDGDGDGAPCEDMCSGF